MTDSTQTPADAECSADDEEHWPVSGREQHQLDETSTGATKTPAEGRGIGASPARGSRAELIGRGASLRVKFRVLLIALGIGVLSALASAWWAGDTIDQDVREPVRLLSGLLSKLEECQHITRRALPEVATSLLDSPDTQSLHGAEQAQALAHTRSIIAQAADATKRLASDEFAREHLGRQGLGNLVDRLTDPHLLQLADGTELRQELRICQDLLDRLRQRVVGDIQNAVRYGGEVRQRVRVVLLVGLAVVLLLVFLSLSLLRRWVLAPVDALRRATAAFAAGDLGYRINTPTPSDRNELLVLSREFNAMAAANQSLQREQIDRERLAAVGEMVRRLAHNLRNPLAGIRGLAELTRADLVVGQGGYGRDNDAALMDELRENQARIIQTVDRFERWLTDLLSVTRPTRVMPELGSVRTWLSGLVEAHRASASMRGVTLTLDQAAGPAQAWFDARHLEHAIAAVLSNAIEAAASGKLLHPDRPARVQVLSLIQTGPEPRPGQRPGPTASKIALNGHDSGWWVIRIDDTGPGVAVEDRERIFKPYITTKPDGNGIGLAMALQVIKAHSGSIEVGTGRWEVEQVLEVWSNPGDNGRSSIENGTQTGHAPVLVEEFGASFILRVPLTGKQTNADESVELASIGQHGAQSGEDSGHRG